jgi:hypothetical protein
LESSRPRARRAAGCGCSPRKRFRRIRSYRLAAAGEGVRRRKVEVSDDKVVGGFAFAVDRTDGVPGTLVRGFVGSVQLAGRRVKAGGGDAEVVVAAVGVSVSSGHLRVPNVHAIVRTVELRGSLVGVTERRGDANGTRVRVRDPAVRASGRTDRVDGSTSKVGGKDVGVAVPRKWGAARESVSPSRSSASASRRSAPPVRRSGCASQPTLPAFSFNEPAEQCAKLSFTMPNTAFVLQLLPRRFAICRLRSSEAIPDWALAPSTFASITRSPTELSIVAEQERIPGGVFGDRGYVALRVEGPLPLTLVGVMACIAKTLAEVEVPIFPIATYDHDYILLPEHALPRATNALKRAGHTVIDANVVQDSSARDEDRI